MSFVTVSQQRNKAFVQNVLSQDAAEIAAQEAEIARRVRLETAKLRDRAEAEARQAGEDAARAAMAPQQAALSQCLAALNTAAAQLAAPLAHKEHELAELVTELAFLLARHITGTVNATPASLQNLVAKLLDEAGAERGPRQILLLRLNPADHDMLAPSIPPETAQLLADDTIAPGGAMLELIAPDGDPQARAEWDATLQGRLATMRAALGLAP